MNYVTYGMARDSNIVSLIEKGSAFTRQQIENIMFSNLKPAAKTRKAQARLQSLYNDRLIKRHQDYPQSQAVYYIKKPKQIDHVLAINDVYAALITQRKQWQQIDFKWSYMVLDGVIIADALCIITNIMSGSKQALFIEVERNPSKRFDKDKQYEKLFEMDWTQEEWAIKHDNKVRFPQILIVTDKPLKVESKLRFIVATLDQVKKDIYSLIMRR